MKTLKEKMYNYEVEPPSDSWQIIVKALDEESSRRIKFMQKK